MKIYALNPLNMSTNKFNKNPKFGANLENMQTFARVKEFVVKSGGEKQFHEMLNYLKIKVQELSQESILSELSARFKNIAEFRNVISSMKNNIKTSEMLNPKHSELLLMLVTAFGIEANSVHSDDVDKFNESLKSLSKTLSGIDDETFASLTITQSYPKESFIKDVLNIVNDMPTNERQKVYDYYGFELQENPEVNVGFSIFGYPANLNNDKKNAQITDSQTKAIVEELRPYVVKFSENNEIISNNPQVEKSLNEIVQVLPEIRTMIEKRQHRTQKFDVMLHSLKVLSKISKDTGFAKLNDSDKKIMILAAILHDITKSEGVSDKTHAMTGSFDAYYICKKLKLTDEENIKLYTLIRNHEWLGYANTARNDDKINMDVLTERLQSIASTLRQDNLFEMALIFTHADLKAVKFDDSFHDSTYGVCGRTDVNGNPRSYGDLADDYAKIIRSYIKKNNV